MMISHVCMFQIFILRIGYFGEVFTIILVFLQHTHAPTFRSDNHISATYSVTVIHRGKNKYSRVSYSSNYSKLQYNY